jgi:hypothetical protein
MVMVRERVRTNIYETQKNQVALTGIRTTDLWIAFSLKFTSLNQLKQIKMTPVIFIRLQIKVVFHTIKSSRSDLPSQLYMEVWWPCDEICRIHLLYNCSISV